VAFAWPTDDVAQAVDDAIPGIWPAFIGRIVEGARNSRSRVRVSSWYRPAAHNARVGGHRDSQHQAGLAFDLVTDNPVRLEMELDRQGLIAVREARHVHVQAYPAGVVTGLVRQIVRDET